MPVAKLTIGICTRDRSCLGTCLRRLSILPGIDNVEVLVVDNSTFDSYITANRECVEGYHFEFVHVKDFMEARNYAVNHCHTEYFMWLDDDDYLSMDALMVIDNIIDFTKADFISFGVKKEGRIQPFNYEVTDISSMRLRYKYLNQFDHYSKDRDTKVYLWNCAVVFKTEQVAWKKRWKYIGCDDILPITEMYLTANKVVRANIPIYYYDVQTYVTSQKLADEVTRLCENMLNSYKEVMNNISNELLKNKYTKKILKRAINNSIRQLEFNDGVIYGPLVQLRDQI